MASKKISELTAKTPAAADVLAVADPSTGIAGKSTCNQITYTGLASWSKFTTYGSFAFQPNTVNISTTTHNLQIGVAGLVKINCTSNTDLTGLVSENLQSNTVITPGGSTTAALDGQVVYLLNTGTNTLTLKHDDSGSSAVNRLYTHNGNNLQLVSGHITLCLYDTAVSRWRVWSLV